MTPVERTGDRSSEAGVPTHESAAACAHPARAEPALNPACGT